MTVSNTQLCLSGLTQLQAEELKAALPPGTVSEEASESLPGGRHAEPALIAVAIQYGPLAIGALAVWLAKQKKRRTEKVVWTKKTRAGTTETITWDVSEYEEGAGAAPKIEALLNKVLRDKSE